MDGVSGREILGSMPGRGVRCVCVVEDRLKILILSIRIAITNFFINPTQSLQALPVPIQLYVRSNPFLPIIHLLDSIFLVSGALGTGHAFHTALPALNQFLHGIRPEQTLAIQRLVVSTIWASISLAQNAEYISSAPWFRFTTIAERLLFIMSIGGTGVMLNELLVKLLTKYHHLDSNAQIWTQERAAALHYFHDSPKAAVDKYLDGSLGIAARIHCLFLICAAARFLLACCVWGRSLLGDNGGVGCFGAKGLIGVPVAFAVSVVAAAVLLAVFEQGETWTRAAGCDVSFLSRMLSVGFASVAYALLIQALGCGKSTWAVWVVSDAMLWAFGQVWSRDQERRTWVDFGQVLREKRKDWCLGRVVY
ncbi:hypothetical protein IQ07DRAFT_600810 [Pyrenochaeta sp. DS3sAY3a]|nr:hypothetical protein IQ07DRAFT_600810 [Pyrenochaeta sp. DS3sAY3a]